MSEPAQPDTGSQAGRGPGGGEDDGRPETTRDWRRGGGWRRRYSAALHNNQQTKTNQVQVDPIEDLVLGYALASCLAEPWARGVDRARLREVEVVGRWTRGACTVGEVGRGRGPRPPGAVARLLCGGGLGLRTGGR